MFETYQKPTILFAEFEAGSWQNHMLLYTIGTSRALPAA